MSNDDFGLPNPLPPEIREILRDAKDGTAGVCIRERAAAAIVARDLCPRCAGTGQELLDTGPGGPAAWGACHGCRATGGGPDPARGEDGEAVRAAEAAKRAAARAHDVAAMRVEDVLREQGAARAEVERLRGAEAATRLRARNQPCGCVVCYCENEDRCLGCGAKNCGTPGCVFRGNCSRIVYVRGSEVERLRKHLESALDAWGRHRTGFPLGHEVAQAIFEAARAALAASTPAPASPGPSVGGPGGGEP